MIIMLGMFGILSTWLYSGVIENKQVKPDVNYCVEHQKVHNGK